MWIITKLTDVSTVNSAISSTIADDNPSPVAIHFDGSVTKIIVYFSFVNLTNIVLFLSI